MLVYKRYTSIYCVCSICFIANHIHSYTGDDFDRWNKIFATDCREDFLKELWKETDDEEIKTRIMSAVLAQKINNE